MATAASTLTATIPAQPTVAGQDKARDDVLLARIAAARVRHAAGTTDHGWAGMELWPE